MNKKKVIAISTVGLLLIAIAGFGIYRFALNDHPMPITASEASAQVEADASSGEAGKDNYEIPPIKPLEPKSETTGAAGANEVAQATANSKQEENTVTVTPNDNGGKDYNVSRPEYNRPPDDETIYDEPQDNGDDNGGSGKPGSNDPQGGGDKPSGGGSGTTGGNSDKPSGGGSGTTGGNSDKPSGGGSGTTGGNSDKPSGGGSGTTGGNSDKPSGGGSGTTGGNDDSPNGGAGGGKPGQIYVPGFGWMDDPGTGSGTGTSMDNAGTGEVIGY